MNYTIILIYYYFLLCRHQNDHDPKALFAPVPLNVLEACLLYTSDAADE